MTPQPTQDIGELIMAAAEARDQADRLAAAAREANLAAIRGWEALDEASMAVAQATPDGAGQAAAVRVPWLALVYSDRWGWWALAGANIHRAASEAVQLARILGAEVRLELNGNAIARAGMTADEVLARRT